MLKIKGSMFVFATRSILFSSGNDPLNMNDPIAYKKPMKAMFFFYAMNISTTIVFHEMKYV